MNEFLRWPPFDRRNAMELMEPFRRLFEGEPERSMMRVEEEIKDNVLTVRAELPGVDPDKDVEIAVTDGTLQIKAERRESSEKKEDDSYRSEFRYGSMFRSIPLPKGVNEEDICATYKDGVLEIRAPLPERGEEGSKRTIPIRRG
ncbi:heat-shock protein Hsp20 [Arthrobacter sp. SW1]|uniref:Hsp20/alpha crystallin family protein n=1 Tax=Arthrobacter sp. SW1 TaxID=1920889 RepID=UPI000877D753|nr:Hsp20/alpha crystallin family protein [Arthrobacter sp. SW1]OFI38129.1 heat-shock protein Hsp20 [Arthrobacter sp. SW1]